jgi:hypothetical protein
MISKSLVVRSSCSVGNKVAPVFIRPVRFVAGFATFRMTSDMRGERTAAVNGLIYAVKREMMIRTDLA